MDPLTLTILSSLAILVTSFIVNIYYVQGHHLRQTEAAATQTNELLLMQTGIQTEECKTSTNMHEETTQFSPSTETIGLNTNHITQADSNVQADKVYYVTLPEQLDQISDQLQVNRMDLMRCMEWIGECEQAVLATTKIVEQQNQIL